MQKTNWLRIGLVGFATIVGSSTALVACGGDGDGDDDIGPGGDAGTSSSSGGLTSSSGGGADGGSSSGGSSGTPAVPAAIILVHGFNAAGPVKVCYATSPTAAPEVGVGLSPLAPLPSDASGLIPGSGGVLPTTGLDLATVFIRPYLIKLSSIDNAASLCPDLIGGSAGLVLNEDYFALDAIGKGVLAANSTFVLIAREDPAMDGRPIAVPYKLDTTTAVPADKIGVQFIHASDYLKPALPSADVAPFIDRAAVAGGDAGDAGNAGFEYLLGADNATKVGPFAAISATKITNPFEPAATTAFGIQIGPSNITVLNRNDGALIPILQWVALSDPSRSQGAGADSLYYKPGNAFTFIALGDPSVPPPNTNPPNNPADVAKVYARPHFLVFPNKPKVAGL